MPKKLNTFILLAGAAIGLIAVGALIYANHSMLEVAKLSAKAHMSPEDYENFGYHGVSSRVFLVIGTVGIPISVGLLLSGTLGLVKRSKKRKKPTAEVHE